LRDAEPADELSDFVLLVVPEDTVERVEVDLLVEFERVEVDVLDSDDLVGDAVLVDVLDSDDLVGDAVLVDVLDSDDLVGDAVLVDVLDSDDLVGDAVLVDVLDTDDLVDDDVEAGRVDVDERVAVERVAVDGLDELDFVDVDSERVEEPDVDVIAEPVERVELLRVSAFTTDNVKINNKELNVTNNFFILLVF